MLKRSRCSSLCRHIAGPGSSNSTTSKPSKPPSDSTKHHPCNSGRKQPSSHKGTVLKTCLNTLPQCINRPRKHFNLWCRCFFTAACVSNPYNSNHKHSVPAPQSDTTQAIGHPHNGGAQRSRRAGAVCQNVQTAANQTGFHTGKRPLKEIRCIPSLVSFRFVNVW